jgi:putative transposase
MLDSRNYPVEVTPFSILSWKGGEWRAEGETPREVHIVGRDDPSQFDVLLKDDLEDLVRSKKLQIREEMFDFLDMSIMSPAERRRTALLMMWVSASIAVKQAGLVCDFSQKSCKLIIDEKGDEVIRRYKDHLVENDFAPTKKGRKVHFASLSDKRKKQHRDIDENRLLLHPRTLSDLMARWEADPSPASLKPKWGQQRGGGKKCDERTWGVVKEHAPKYARENMRTYDGALQFINAEISARNSLVGKGARIPEATSYMVRKAIDEIPSFAKLFTRRGPSRMRNALRSVGHGPKFTRPGEEIIIDGWEAHVWTLLSPEVQEMFSLEIRQVRLLICPSIDHASGFITSLSAAPTGETAVLTTKSLRMIGCDRTALARAAGCLSDWGPPLGVEILSQDSGSGLWNQVYMQAAYVLADSVDHKAAGLPWLRGTIERVLRTMDTKFVQNFIARTGSNILATHENEPNKRAAIAADFFMRLFVRFIVDVYHHTPRQKGRMIRPSPYRQFHAGLEVQQKAPPNKDRQRIGFGKVLERELTPQGLRFMNIQYRSKWLDKLLQNEGPHGSRRKQDKLLVKIKVDPMDLGCISALIDGRWVTIPGPRELSGIDLDTWIEMGDRNAREIGEQARIDFEKFVAPALLDIDAGARRAERQLGFTDLDWTADMMNEAERLLRTFVVYDREPVGHEPGVSGSSRQLGKVMSRPAPEGVPVGSPVEPSASDVPPHDTPPASPGAPKRRTTRSRR